MNCSFKFLALMLGGSQMPRTPGPYDLVPYSDLHGHSYAHIPSERQTDAIKDKTNL